MSDHEGKTHNETRLSRKEEKAPPPPEEMVDALQDRVYTEAGPTRPAKSYRHDPTGQRSDERDEIGNAEVIILRALRRVTDEEFVGGRDALSRLVEMARSGQGAVSLEAYLDATSGNPKFAALTAEIATLRKRAVEEPWAIREEHDDTAPHIGCGCLLCKALRRAKAAEKRAEEAEAKAEQYVADWMSAKYDFGNAMAKARALLAEEKARAKRLKALAERLRGAVTELFDHSDLRHDDCETCDRIAALAQEGE